MQSWRFLSAVCCLALLGGCVFSSRSYLRLDVPRSSATATAPAGKAVVIDSVRDARKFEEDPSDPSVPSLKKGAKYKLDTEQRKRAIARKRNTYGLALGDILLEEGQTVETLTRSLVANGFVRHGYAVFAPGAAPADAVHVDVVIDEFWAWYTPGFWHGYIEGKIRTLIRTGTAVQLDVHGYGKNSSGRVGEDYWREAYDRTFRDYAARFDEAFESSGM